MNLFFRNSLKCNDPNSKDLVQKEMEYEAEKMKSKNRESEIKRPDFLQ